MDRLLIAPDRGMTDMLNQNMSALLALQTKSLGSGAIREERQAGSTSVSSANTNPVTILSTLCDPGDWLIVYGCCVGLDNTIQAGTPFGVQLEDIPVTSRQAIRYYPGQAAEQLLGMIAVRFTALTDLNLQFFWSGGSGSASVFAGQLTLVPA